jgi:diguanylate cyclase
VLDELRATALSDPLTGLPNRRAWDERFQHELALAGHSGRPLSVAAIDLGKLKQANDLLGHEHGGRLIQCCAQLSAAALRETDFIARIGGDEFLVLLPDSTSANAERVARRMLSAVSAQHSFSIGLATWDGNEEGYELMHRADKAMYAAKAAGGGRITLANGRSGGPLALAEDSPQQGRRAS